MKPPVGFTLAGFFAVASWATPVELSGTVLDLDSTAKSGVSVSLSGSSLSTVTKDDGTWSLSGATSLLPDGVRAASKLPSKRVVLDGGRLLLSLDGRGIDGRVLPGARSSPASSTVRTSFSGELDTLVYSWNGKVFLRDTIGEGGLSQTGIPRFFDTTVNPAIAHGYVEDDQGHLYRTVKIGAQTWMAQNLDLAVDSSWCPGGVAGSCARYGRLYQWAAVMGLDAASNAALWSGSLPRRGLCPSGWHVPSDSEWSVLVRLVDSSASGTSLRAGGNLWSPHGGTDAWGFRILPAGFRNFDGSYGSGAAYFWSASQFDAYDVWGRSFEGDIAASSRPVNLRANGFGARCLAD